jgi:hypothetical protein
MPWSFWNRLLTRSPRLSHRPTCCRPAIESLEDRRVPSTFTVTGTDDAGPGTLRQAILDANASTAPNTIAFSISGSGVQTIQPASPLPTLMGVAVVDGTTQPGYAGAPLIELNGSAAGPDANGLTLHGGNSTVKGLIINGFAKAAIVLTTGWTNTITGNYLGTDPTGTTAEGNGEGIHISFSSNNRLGGTTAADRNLISGSRGSGIDVTTDALSTGNAILGNYIGTDVTGSHALGNRTGVELQEAGNPVGGTDPGAGNFIAFNGNDGVLIDGGAGNAIQHNSIFANANLGIELINGGNNNQVAPALTSAVAGGGATVVQGTFTGRASTTYTIEFFADTNDPAQGKQFLGSVTVTTGADGTASVMASFNLELSPGQWVTATATDPTNNTSAFSQGVAVSD